jgi:hypothetical protein
MIALLPVQALADDCPRGAEALDKGVTVVFDWMEITYRRQEDGLVRETEFYPEDGSTLIYISEPTGLSHLFWELDPDGQYREGSEEEYVHDYPKGLPQPVPATTWDGRETTEGSFGTFQTRVSWSYGTPETVTIGPCSYAALRALETRRDLPERDGDEIWVNQYLHLPELGMTLYLGGHALGEAPYLERPLAILPSGG